MLLTIYQFMIYEKMISGMYLGELVRQILIHMIKCGLILKVVVF